MKSAAAKGVAVWPDEYIRAALSPEERLEAALRVGREAFRGTELTLADVAVRKVRRKRHGARAKQGLARSELWGQLWGQHEGR
jgi:hypothetical protein